MAERMTSSAHRAAGEWVVFLCCLLVGGTFLYASLGKIIDPAGFAKAVHNYRLLPAVLLHPFALLLPWLEAVVAVALILGVARRGAALLALAMTVMFTVAVGAALVRNLDISCGCFHTDGGQAVGTSLLVRDIALLLVILVPLLSNYEGWSLVRLLRHRAA